MLTCAQGITEVEQALTLPTHPGSCTGAMQVDVAKAAG